MNVAVLPASGSGRTGDEFPPTVFDRGTVDEQKYEVEDVSRMPQDYNVEFELDETWKCKNSKAAIKSFQVIAPR